MRLNIRLENNAIRLTMLVILIVISVFAGKMIWKELVIGVFSDSRVSGPGILDAVELAPDSSMLRARLAELQLINGGELEAARQNIDLAIKYSPNDFSLRLLKSRIEEESGNKLEAESSYADAARLAPKYSEVYWLAGNFYLRNDEFDKAITQFQKVANLNPSLVPAILDMVWTVSDGNASIMNRVVGQNAESMLKLASFFAKKGRGKDAEEVYSQIDKSVIKANTQLNSFFVALLQNGFPLTSKRLWLSANDINDETGIFNGGFEETEFSSPTEFDWTFTSNKYARLQMDARDRHSGSRSLLIDFRGVETTILSSEIGHLLPLPPKKKLRVTFFVKTDKLSTESAPKIVIENAKQEVLAASDAIPTGTQDWQCMAFEVETPPAPDGGDSQLLYLRVKKIAPYAFEKPTFGRIWLDDFAISEGGGQC